MLRNVAGLPGARTDASREERQLSGTIQRTNWLRLRGFVPLVVALLGCPDRELDTKDCDGNVLSDSAFDITVVRDRRDPSSGALENLSVRPLGGGEGYGRIEPHPKSVVRTADQLRSALGGPVAAPFAVGGPTEPRTIYIDDDVELDLSYCARVPRPSKCIDPRSGPNDAECDGYSLVIPAHTILASGRGRGGSLGARLFSRTFTVCPLLDVRGNDVRITGLRLHGPDPSIENDEQVHCDGEPRAIGVFNKGAPPVQRVTDIDNNDISAWSVAIDVDGVLGVQVHHNVIQFNRREENNGTCGSHDYGLGYGVVVSAGSATITANVFDHNRHDIASAFTPGSQYTATYNLVLAGAVDHSFDVHGGEDAGNCTNIAGSAFVIHHNTFQQAHKPAVRVRGIPLQGAYIYKNDTRDHNSYYAFTQINALGHFSATDNRENINHFPAWFISFGGSTFWHWRQFESQDLQQALVGDFNGDGAADVMRANSSGWQWSRSALDGWAFLNTLRDPVSKVVVGDFVGTTLSDIVRATGSEWQVSDGGTSPWRPLVAQRAQLSSAAFGDFEGDNKVDAFFADGTQWTIIQSYSPLVRRHESQPFKLSQLRFGNFVGDSKLDVLRSTGHEWLVWDHLTRTWNHLNFSQIPLSDLVFADFDGNGLTDIARSSGGRWYVSWDGQSQWQILNTSDIGIKSLLIADFNGDRKADVLSRQSPAP